MMNREEARHKLMEYLYDELPIDEKSELERIIAADPSLKEDLKEMKQMRKLMQFAPKEKSQSPLVFIEPGAQGAPQNEQKKNKKHVAGLPRAAVTALSIAASILIILFGSALAGLQVTSSAAGFTIGFGEAATVPEEDNRVGVTDEDLMRLAEQIRTENSLLISAMMDDLQDQQRQQLQEAIQVLNTYYVQQREEDLNIIADGMNQLQVETAYKFLQTDETIENIIYALNNQ
ncbi:MAG: hypothetical protein GVY02_06660 [Bacteroidetes bacterium]|jgi:hypothetical protein|nr:hypothetical protein [Bacteroidota bacterium]